MILPYLVQKEVKQILRNRILPVIFVLLPLVLTNVLPRIATQEVKGIRFAAVDNDRSSLSRGFVQRLDASTYLDLAATAPTYAAAFDAIDAGDVDAIVEIPAGYERDAVCGRPSALQVSANAVNGTKGSMAAMYITQTTQWLPPCPVGALYSETSPKPLSERAGGESPSISVRAAFNPTLDYKPYMIPAIFALLLILIVGFLPALNIVGEKERGTMEQINVSPIGKMTFILSKVIPYIIIGLLMTLEALAAARGIHGISPVGSVPLLMLFVIVFCMLASSIGLIISNYSSTMQQAALTMFFFLVIFILMSGLLTPIASMPMWAQEVTRLNPLRYIIAALRDVFLKGSTFTDLLPQFVPLVVYAAAAWTWAIKSYRKNA